MRIANVRSKGMDRGLKRLNQRPTRTKWDYERTMNIGCRPMRGGLQDGPHWRPQARLQATRARMDASLAWFGLAKGQAAGPKDLI